MIKKTLILVFVTLCISHQPTLQNPDNLMDVLFEFVEVSLNQTLESSQDEISKKCYDAVNNTINDSNKLYMIKLMRDSAKNKNDLGSFLDCFTITYLSSNKTTTDSIKDNITYMIFHIKKEKDWYPVTDTRYESGNVIYGGCVSKGCNTTEFRQLFYSLNYSTGFPNASIDNIHVIDYGEQIYYHNFFGSMTFYLQIIPIFLVIFFFLWSCSPSIPLSIFKCFFRKPIVLNEIIHNDYDVDIKDIRKRFEEDEGISDMNTKEKLLEGNNPTVTIGDFPNQSDDYSKGESSSKINYDQKRLNKFLRCFMLIDNAEEIMNTNTSMNNVNLNNDSGLSIVKGMRALTMIFLIIGYVFKILYTSPIKIFCNVTYRNMVVSYFYAFILYGIRFGPNVFFALSAYCLTYKFLSFLDNEQEALENRMKKDAETSEKNNRSSVNNTENSLFKKSYPSNKIKDVHDNENGDSESENDKTYSFHEDVKNYPTTPKTKQTQTVSTKSLENKKFLSYSPHSNISVNISYSKLFYFIFSQSHKYIMFLFAIFFFKYSFYNFVAALYTPGPMWSYMKESIVDSFTDIHMISTIFLFVGFSNCLFTDYDIFWIASSEIFYFILFSFIIFVFYRKNWRLDLFLIISFFLLICGKLAIYILVTYLNDNNWFFPSYFLHNKSNYFIRRNPFYNISSYIIGLFFGLINYCIQKSISFDNYNDLNKMFLYIPCKFKNLFRNHHTSKVLTTSIFFGLLFLAFILCFNIILLGFFKNDIYMNEFYQNFWVNIFFVNDVEFGIISMFIIILPLFLIGDNFVIAFLKHEYWNFLARPYFTFILQVNIVTIYVFYQSESRVKLETFNVIFFSLLVLIMLMIISAACYISFEVPLKKLNKFILEEIMKKSNTKEEPAILSSITKKE